MSMKALINSFVLWQGALLVLVAVGYSLLGFDRGLNVYDEGVPVYGALCVLGGLPNRD
jgi:hypothetical protein